MLALGVVGSFDYENELMEEEAYCDRLKNKVHTDYNHIKSTCIARHWNN